MKVFFGFLPSSQTYTADVPDELDPTPIATSTIVADGTTNTIQLTPARDVAQLHGLLNRRADLDLAASGAQVYERTVDPGLLIAFWPISWGAVTTQTTTEPNGQAVLGRVLSGVRVSEDAHRIARLTIGRGVSLGNRRDPIQRDSVRFLGVDRTLWFSVEFDDTQGLGSEGTQTTADLTFVTSTLPFGVSVTCAGPNDRADDLTTILRAVVASTTEA